MRGTMAVLRREFGREIRAQAGVYASAAIVRAQNADEADAAIHSFCLDGPWPRWSRVWWARQANKRLGTSFATQHRSLQPHLQGAAVALEIGGDNYSFDYGKPDGFMEMDCYLQRRKIPVVLWGASVGPFDADPVFARRMFDHLRSLAAVFVRESASLEYLQANGVRRNVHRVADPAFVMQPAEPSAAALGCSIPVGAIGINLSPLVARFRGLDSAPADLTEWLSFCSGLLKSASMFNRPILLIPHVAAEWPGNDDFALLQALGRLTAAGSDVPIRVLPPGLNAAEIKWVIGRCSVFVGARTHATIAALSSLVPTLSISYSLKARGINRDIFDNLDYCIPVSDLDAENFSERLGTIIRDAGRIQAHLASRIPELQGRAFSAGPLLRKALLAAGAQQSLR